MFDITKLGSNSTRVNQPNLQYYGACHHEYSIRNICVRMCETDPAATKATHFFAGMSAVHSAANNHTVAHR